MWPMAPGGEGPRPVTDTADPRNSDNPAWSPDVSKILFDTNRSGESVELWIMNADGSEPTRLIADAFGQISWQPISITGPCVGDCDGDDSVVVAELVTLIGISLGNIALVDCPAGNASVDELLGRRGETQSFVQRLSPSPFKLGAFAATQVPLYERGTRGGFI